MADHKKIFENIDINSLDDGTFTIRVRPVEKETKDNEVPFSRSKEMSASGVKNLMEKLNKIIGKSEEMEEEKEEDPLEEFMSAHIGDANSD